MKKYFTVMAVIVTAFLLTYCNPAKKAAASADPPPVIKSTYETGVSVMIMNNCSPCHIPAKGGNKKPYDNFANVKTDIDEIIRRIELNPGDKGFMPFKKTAKLSDSTINIFKQWKTDGLIEKL